MSAEDCQRRSDRYRRFLFIISALSHVMKTIATGGLFILIDNVGLLLTEPSKYVMRACFDENVAPESQEELNEYGKRQGIDQNVLDKLQEARRTVAEMKIRSYASNDDDNMLIATYKQAANTAIGYINTGLEYSKGVAENARKKQYTLDPAYNKENSNTKKRAETDPDDSWFYDQTEDESPLQQTQKQQKTHSPADNLIKEWLKTTHSANKKMSKTDSLNQSNPNTLRKTTPNSNYKSGTTQNINEATNPYHNFIGQTTPENRNTQQLIDRKTTPVTERNFWNDVIKPTLIQQQETTNTSPTNPNHKLPTPRNEITVQIED